MLGRETFVPKLRRFPGGRDLGSGTDGFKNPRIGVVAVVGPASTKNDESDRRATPKTAAWVTKDWYQGYSRCIKGVNLVICITNHGFSRRDIMV